MFTRGLCISFAMLGLCLSGSWAVAAITAPISPGSLLALGRQARKGSGPGALDSVEARLVDGTWTAPNAGDTVVQPDGKESAWEEITPDKDATRDAASAVNPGFDPATMPAGAKITWLGANGGPRRASASSWPLAEDAYIEQAHFKSKLGSGGSAAMINRVYYDGHAGALKYTSPY